MTFNDKPRLIIDYSNFEGIFEEPGIQLTKIIEKISEEFGIIIGLAPPFPFLVKFHDKFEIPFFSHLHYNTGTQKTYYHNSIEYLKALDIKGVIISDDKIPIIDLERYIRNSRTFRLYTLAYSHNVAISAAISKFDPNAIIFRTPENISKETPLSKIPHEMIENHVKRVNIENPKVSVFSGVRIHGKIDIEKGLEHQIEGYILEIASALLRAPHEFLVDIVKPLQNM